MSQQKMYKKTHLAKRTIALIGIFYFFNCIGIERFSIPGIERSSIPGEERSSIPQLSPKEELEYKFHNGQIFIKIALHSPDRMSSTNPSNEWALLDSSATQNLRVDLNSSETIEFSWQRGEHRISQLFHPLGNSTPSEYRIILGQPFFRANCIILNRGIPEIIKPHKKKRCPVENPGHWQWIQMHTAKGQILLKVNVNQINMEFSLDTGSGMTAVPGTLLSSYMRKTEKKKKVLYTFGSFKEQIVYELLQPLKLSPTIEFQANEVLDSEQVWEDNYEYFPTLGMDFFRTFRVYIDLGSKSIGIEDHGKQR